MPRWFRVTAFIALFVAMSAGVLYAMPAPRSIAGFLLILLLLVGGAGEVAGGLYDRRHSKTDEPTALNLTGK
jgi:hypothetical protein